jgi:hypothetical protein
MCGATNSRPSDPGTLRPGCASTTTVVGVTESFSDAILRQTHELTNLVKAAKGANSPITDDEIYEKVRQSVELDRRAQLNGFDDGGLTRLMSEMRGAVGEYVKRKYMELGKITREAKDPPDDSDDDESEREKKVKDGTEAVMKAAEWAQRLGCNDAATTGLAEAGGGVVTLLQLKTDALFSLTPHSTRVVLPQESIKKIIAKTKDVLLSIKQTEQASTAISQRAYAAVENALTWLFNYRSETLKARRALVDNDTVAKSDPDIKQAALDLLETEDSLRKLGVSIPPDYGRLDLAKKLISG